jgi:hypothetical protein
MRPFAAAVITVVLLGGAAAPFAQQEVQPPGRGRRPSPPQPQQQQGIEYFVGTWTFSWTGRESPISSGPRAGTMTFTRRGSAPIADAKTDGKSDGGATYQETASFEWNAADKTLAITEKLAGGIELKSVGDWSSPIGIKVESAPVKVGARTITLRRFYSILSAQSFAVTDEISMDGGPFQRLGNGRFTRNQ